MLLLSVVWAIVVLAFFAYLLHFTTVTVTQDPACSSCPAAHQRNGWRTFVQLFLLLLVVNAVCGLAIRLTVTGASGQRSSITLAQAAFTLLLMPVFVYAMLRWTRELRQCNCPRLQNGIEWLRALAIFEAVVLAGTVLIALYFGQTLHTLYSAARSRSSLAASSKRMRMRR